MIGLATADEAVIIKLGEAKAGVGLEVAAVEAAEAVDRDAGGLVLFHHVDHGGVHLAGFMDVVGRGFDDALGLFGPLVGENAGRILKDTGAAAVKLESSVHQADTIRALTAAEIPVMAHVGMRPQSVRRLGSMGKIQRDEEILLAEAKAAERGKVRRRRSR